MRLGESTAPQLTAPRVCEEISSVKENSARRSEMTAGAVAAGRGKRQTNESAWESMAAVPMRMKFCQI